MRNKYIYITLLAVLGWNAETTAQNGTKRVPRLVVNITIDQFRSDFMETYIPLYGTDGFKKLIAQGRVYENASYPLIQTDRASAISTIQTGAVPYFHSIVGVKACRRYYVSKICHQERSRSRRLHRNIHAQAALR